MGETAYFENAARLAQEEKGLFDGFLHAVREVNETAGDIYKQWFVDDPQGSGLPNTSRPQTPEAPAADIPDVIGSAGPQGSQTQAQGMDVKSLALVAVAVIVLARVI